MFFDDLPRKLEAITLEREVSENLLPKAEKGQQNSSNNIIEHTVNMLYWPPISIYALSST